MRPSAQLAVVRSLQSHDVIEMGAAIDAAHQLSCWSRSFAAVPARRGARCCAFIDARCVALTNRHVARMQHAMRVACELMRRADVTDDIRIRVVLLLRHAGRVPTVRDAARSVLLEAAPDAVDVALTASLLRTLTYLARDSDAPVMRDQQRCLMRTMEHDMRAAMRLTAIRCTSWLLVHGTLPQSLELLHALRQHVLRPVLEDAERIAAASAILAAVASAPLQAQPTEVDRREFAAAGVALLRHPSVAVAVAGAELSAFFIWRCAAGCDSAGTLMPVDEARGGTTASHTLPPALGLMCALMCEERAWTDRACLRLLRCLWTVLLHGSRLERMAVVRHLIHCLHLGPPPSTMVLVSRVLLRVAASLSTAVALCDEDLAALSERLCALIRGTDATAMRADALPALCGTACATVRGAFSRRDRCAVVDAVRGAAERLLRSPGPSPHGALYVTACRALIAGVPEIAEGLLASLADRVASEAARRWLGALSTLARAECTVAAAASTGSAAATQDALAEAVRGVRCSALVSLRVRGDGSSKDRLVGARRRRLTLRRYGLQAAMSPRVTFAFMQAFLAVRAEMQDAYLRLLVTLASPAMYLDDAAAAAQAGAVARALQQAMRSVDALCTPFYDVDEHSVELTELYPLPRRCAGGRARRACTLIGCCLNARRLVHAACAVRGAHVCP